MTAEPPDVGATGAGRERAARLAFRVERVHRRVALGLGACGVPVVLLAGLARSRLHGLLDTWWTQALFDTTFLLALYVGALALVALPWLARADARRYLGAVTLSGCVLSLLALGEVGVRAFRPTEARLRGQVGATILTQSDQRLAPNREGQAGGVPLRSNRFGLRGPDVPAEKPPGTTRILALGDSYTFGSGVLEERTWPFRVAALLRERFPGRAFDVLNAGHDGFSAADERRELEHFLPLVDPDLVLVGACQNDHWIHAPPYDARRRWRYALVGDDLAAGAMHRSALCAVAALAYDKCLLSLGLRDTQAAVHAALADVEGENWRAFLAAHGAMQELAARAGKLPPLVQVLANVTRRGPEPDGGPMHARYLEALAAIGVRAHTALEELARLEGEYLVLNDWDSHPNDKGHDAYARAFVRELLARGYLDERGAPRAPSRPR